MTGDSACGLTFLQMAELRPKRSSLSTGTVARALGVSRWTIRNWIEARIVRADRLPTGVYRIPASELDRIRAGLPMDATPHASLPTTE